jgi:hypothetical protein
VKAIRGAGGMHSACVNAALGREALALADITLDVNLSERLSLRACLHDLYVDFTAR